MGRDLDEFRELKEYWLNHRPLSVKDGLRIVKVLEKEHKALQIIKEKQVNMLSLLSSIEWFNPSHYNDSVGCPVGCELTQKEYDLLKEVLQNG